MNLEADDAQDTDDACPRCGCCDQRRRTCNRCGGEGETEAGELYEEDPLWYDPDDTAPCHECGGAGVFIWCAGDCDKDGKHKPLEASP